MAVTETSVPSPHAAIRSQARVLENRVEGSGRILTLAVPNWPGSIPGQFLMIGAGAESEVVRHDPLLPRPMAVYRELGPVKGAASGLSERSIELLYRVVGRGTTLLSEAEPGESISMVGPLGRGFPVDSGANASSGPAILVGGGTGIASLFELAKALGETDREVVVILGARSALDLTGKDDFSALGVELVCTTEDGSVGLAGRVTDPLLARLEAAQGRATVFAVGPTPMMKACAELAARHGSDCLVSLENPMACGFGVCLGCAAPRAEGGFSLVCKEGPVFEAREIDWEGLP